MYVDLHVHTTFSDGLLAPQQVVKKAFELKLKAVAITDHDTVKGIQPALDAAKSYKGIEVVPGIEFSTEYFGEEVHILGYYIDFCDKNLNEFLTDLQEGRKKRIYKIVSKLQSLRIDIFEDEVFAKSKGASIGRPHVAMVLCDKGYVNSIEEAFEKYLSKDAPAYVPKEKITPFYAVDLIYKKHGIPILAHPGLLKNKNIVSELISYGIKGIEVIHKDHTKEDIQLYAKLAKDNNLLLTGGSDSHGETPLLLGSFNVPVEYFYKLKEMKDRSDDHLD